jgi:hypothetical protein
MCACQGTEQEDVKRGITANPKYTYDALAGVSHRHVAEPEEIVVTEERPALVVLQVGDPEACVRELRRLFGVMSPRAEPSTLQVDLIDTCGKRGGDA